MKHLKNFDGFDTNINEAAKVYTDSKIRSVVKYSIKEAFSKLKKRVKETKSVDEVKSILSVVHEEIDKLREILSGTIVLAINEAFDVSGTLNNLKTVIKDLLHKKTDKLELAKREALARLSDIESDLLEFVKKMDIDVEKTNAKIAKSKSQAFRSQIF